MSDCADHEWGSPNIFLLSSMPHGKIVLPLEYALANKMWASSSPTTQAGDGISGGGNSSLGSGGRILGAESLTGLEWACSVSKTLL